MIAYEHLSAPCRRRGLWQDWRRGATSSAPRPPGGGQRGKQGLHFESGLWKGGKQHREWPQRGGSWRTTARGQDARRGSDLCGQDLTLWSNSGTRPHLCLAVKQPGLAVPGAPHNAEFPKSSDKHLQGLYDRCVQKQFKCCGECHKTNPNSLQAGSFISSSGRVTLYFETCSCLSECHASVFNKYGQCVVLFG